MKSFFKNLSSSLGLLSIIVLALSSCAPQVELTSSWTNKQASVKSNPTVMVMVLGSNLQNCQSVEGYLAAEISKGGSKVIQALDVFQPNAQKLDSSGMVALLRSKNIDMLLINSVVDITEKERYVPGTTEKVAVGSYATPYNPVYSPNYYYQGSYNNYYGYYNSYNYQTVYETRTTPGYTYTEVTVIIESKLYDVNKPELVWFGQSTAFTKDPSTELFKGFSKNVTNDIRKNGLLK